MVRELIRLDDVHRAFGAVKVLDGVNLRIEEGDRIGVVGHNGAGKTTLLRTISDQEQDIGDISFAPGLRIAYLTQIRDIDENATLEEELNRRGHQFKELEEELNKTNDIVFVEGRGLFHELKIKNNYITLIDESYNASPYSMKNCINYFEKFFPEIPP